MAITQVTNELIAAGGVHTTNVADDAITTLKLADDAVTSSKLADDSVGVDAINSDIRAVQYVGIDTGDYIQFTADTQMDFYINSSNEMRLEADGDLHVDGDVIAASTTVSSDKKLKKDIKPITEALEILNAIKGVNFTWKKNDKKSSGVIAQDIQSVMPHLVKEVKELDSNDSHLAVNYDGLIGVLIEAVKELKAEVETLKIK